MINTKSKKKKVKGIGNNFDDSIDGPQTLKCLLDINCNLSLYIYIHTLTFTSFIAVLGTMQFSQNGIYFLFCQFVALHLSKIFNFDENVIPPNAILQLLRLSSRLAEINYVNPRNPLRSIRPFSCYYSINKVFYPLKFSTFFPDIQIFNKIIILLANIGQNHLQQSSFVYFLCILFAPSVGYALSAPIYVAFFN